MKNQNDNRINLVIQNVLKNLNELIDVNTVMGKPIIMENGDCVFPISKVTLGVLSGGGEYGKIGMFTKNDELPFSAGNGAIVSMKPSGFLIKDKFGYKMISATNDPYEKIIDKASDFINNIKGEE